MVAAVLPAAADKAAEGRVDGASARSGDRSRSPMRLEHQRVVAAARRGLRELCDKHRIPESHGVEHAFLVQGHADRALEAATRRISAARSLSIRLAALLHDVDDRKYFKDTPKDEYPNAKQEMEKAGADEKVVADALQMIGWVSCSKNGNAIPSAAVGEPELLWPRWADRLEATGERGVVRCWQYALETKGVMSCATTPKPQTEAEVWELATPARFERYMSSGGHSDSMIDHYYDKLIRVTMPPLEQICNPYLEAKMKEQVAPLLDVCLCFSRSGEAAALEVIREMSVRCGEPCADAGA